MSPPSAVNRSKPSRSAALAQYRDRADRYDRELAPFEPLRGEAIAALDLKRGDVVLDVGCGTGLSFELLRERIGKGGRIVGIEQSPEMIAKARARVEGHHWTHVDLIAEPAATAHVDSKCDGALFHFTHDVLREPAAIANVLSHLKRGAHVVATGLQWAPPWVWPTNAFVMLAAMYSVTSLEGLAKPWSLLERHLSHFDVMHTLFGGIYIARGEYTG